MRVRVLNFAILIDNCGGAGSEVELRIQISTRSKRLAKRDRADR